MSVRSPISRRPVQNTVRALIQKPLRPGQGRRPSEPSAPSRRRLPAAGLSRVAPSDLPELGSLVGLLAGGPRSPKSKVPEFLTVFCFCCPFPLVSGRVSYPPGPVLESAFLLMCFCRQKPLCILGSYAFGGPLGASEGPPAKNSKNSKAGSGLFSLMLVFLVFSFKHKQQIGNFGWLPACGRSGGHRS